MLKLVIRTDFILLKTLIKSYISCLLLCLCCYNLSDVLENFQMTDDLGNVHGISNWTPYAINVSGFVSFTCLYRRIFRLFLISHCLFISHYVVNELKYIHFNPSIELADIISSNSRELKTFNLLVPSNQYLYIYASEKSELNKCSNSTLFTV